MGAGQESCPCGWALRVLLNIYCRFCHYLTMSFSESYHQFKDYTTPVVRDKHIRRLDREFWEPTGCKSHMAVLEIGCGTGLFLAYLEAKGVSDFLGIDADPCLKPYVPEHVKDRFLVTDIFAFLENMDEEQSYDRVALFDVLEHFTAEEGLRLLRQVGGILRPGGNVIIKVPNAASPWGLQFQFGDLTHKTAYSPDSLRQQAIAAGLTCTACYPHYLGSPSRQLFDRAFHGILDRVLMSRPEIWSPNFFAVLQPA